MASFPCYYALGGINFKNGYATSCPQQSDKLFDLNDENYLPSKFFNSPKFLKHRLDLLNGVWPKGCDMCQHVEEQRAGRSMRQEISADFEYVNTETGEVDFNGLKTIEIRFSHICNMACLHCSEVFSSNWSSKLKNYEPDDDDRKYNLIQLTKIFHRKSSSDDFTISIDTDQAIKIAEDLNKNFKNIERIDFSGGEVLYQKQFIPTLEKLSEHPNAKNIHIMFHTNFNVNIDFKKLYDILVRFRKTSLQISIDSGPRIYSYFRNGSWELLENNIKKFKSFMNKTDNIDINLVCTTGVYQLMEIEDIVRSFLKLDGKYINFSIIYTPNYQNPALMKIHFKEKLLEDLNRVKIIIDQEEEKRKLDFDNSKKLFSYLHKEWKDLISIKESLQNLENYILNHTVEEDTWKSFIAYTQKTKVIWKKDFNEHFKKYKLTNDGVIIRTDNV